MSDPFSSDSPASNASTDSTKTHEEIVRDALFPSSKMRVIEESNNPDGSKTYTELFGLEKYAVKFSYTFTTLFEREAARLDAMEVARQRYSSQAENLRRTKGSIQVRRHHARVSAQRIRARENEELLTLSKEEEQLHSAELEYEQTPIARATPHLTDYNEERRKRLAIRAKSRGAATTVVAVPLFKAKVAKTEEQERDENIIDLVEQVRQLQVQDDKQHQQDHYEDEEAQEDEQLDKEVQEAAPKPKKKGRTSTEEAKR